MTDVARSTRHIVLGIVLTLVASIGLVVGPAAIAATGTSVVTLTPIESTFSNAAKPSTRFGNKSYLSFTKKQSKTYLKFDGAGLKGRKVLSASLQLKVAYSNAKKKGVAVFPSSSRWSARTLTARNQPAASKIALNKPTGVARSGKTIKLPLSKVSTISSGKFSFRLAYSQPYVSGVFGKNGKSSPVLKVTVQDPPSPPAPTPTTPSPG